MKNIATKISTIIIFLLITSCFKQTDPQPDLLTQEVTQIDNLLAKDTAHYIYYHPSGIRLQISKFGAGIPFHNGQTINYSFICTKLGDNAVLDSGTVTKNFSEINPTGLKFGLTILPTGSEYNIYLPSTFAYGTAGNAKIKPNTTLVYSVKIKSISLSPTEQAQLQTDTIAIRKFLNDNAITKFTFAPNGIFYHIDTLTNRPKPNILQNVDFGYTGVLQSNGSTFDDGEIVAPISNLIDGLKYGLPLLAPGSRATFYIPSVYGYGSSGASGIPPNANLLFKVKLY